MMTSVLALAMMGVRTPIQDTQLDLAVPGATLRAVSEQIGEKMGWDIQLDPNVANEVVVLRTKGMDAQAVIAEIAKVTGTRWTANGDQMLIQPDFEARNAELAKARAENAQKISEARRKFLEGMKPQTYKDEDGEEFTYEPEDDRKLLAEMVAGLTDQFFQNIGPGQRVVLSSNPTPMQRALGRFNAQAITQWIQKVNESRTMSDEERAGMMNDPEYQQMMQMFGIDPAQVMPKPITEQPQKVLFIVERNGRTEYDQPFFRLSLKVQGQAGKTLLSSEGMMSADGGEYPYGMGEIMEVATAQGVTIPIPGQEGEEEKPREPMEGDDIPMTTSEDAQAVFDATTMDFEDPTAVKMSPKARQILLQVDQYEPMRYELGEYLLQAAEKMDKPLVALLPDRVYRYGRELPQKFGEVRDMFEGYAIQEATENGIWKITPKKLGQAWTERFDRRALASMLSEAQSRFFISLDTYATFAYMFPDSNRNSIVAQRTAMFAPAMSLSFVGADANDMLRLYGAMSMAERRTLRDGGSLTMGRLSSNARGVLQEMFFGYMPTLDKVDLEKDLQVQGPESLMNDMMGGASGFFGGGGFDQGSEPTDVMPNGLPVNGVVAMKSNPETYLLAVSKEGVVMPGMPPIGRMELAFVSMMMKNPEFLAEMDQYGEMLRNLRAGTRDNLHIAVLAAPGLGAKGVLSDVGDPDMSKTYGLQNLPSELKAQMDADREALEKSPMGKFFEMMGTGFGGPTGPIKP